MVIYYCKITDLGDKMFARIVQLVNIRWLITVDNTHKNNGLLMAKDPKIDARDDVRPGEGEHKYGNVDFADPTNKKYPIDTPEHVRAAWSYINHKDNAAKYDADEVETIKKRIKAAAKKHDVTIEGN